MEEEVIVLKDRPLLVQAGTRTDQILTPPCSMSSNTVRTAYGH